MIEFYYDESEHSRKITAKTVSDPNYYDNFLAVIVGWETNRTGIVQRMTDFKEKHKQRQSGKKNEIKSKTLPKPEFRYGFASLQQKNVTFIEDFLSIFDENTHLYIFAASKMEYIIRQLVSPYRFIASVNVNALSHVIAKAIIQYRPKEIISQIGGTPNEMLHSISVFLEKRIAINQANPILKRRENAAFAECLYILNRYNVGFSPTLEWCYIPAFDGFIKYLNELHIDDYTLTLDQEGNAQRTLKAAQKAGSLMVTEDLSENQVGIQIADMMAGIIGKLMRAISENLKYDNTNNGTKKITLSESWFRPSDAQLNLYKTMRRIVCEWDHVWYKTYAGSYSDDFVTFIALLDYMSQFDTAESMERHSGKHSELFNDFVCTRIAERFLE